MAISFSVSKAEFTDLVKNGQVSLIRSYGSYWRKRIDEELSIELHGVKGKEEMTTLSPDNPSICEVVISITEEKCYGVVTEVGWFTDANGKLKVKLVIIWSDALNQNAEITGALVALQKNLKENLWFYTTLGLGVLGILFVILRLTGAL